ncbi:flagellin [Clostridium tyrobutyricum]|uniref:flagellin N-terminal helical domain-containing protein n=1 Tax=Clostridium tyrobutyricum TaxID=1519 RepID=UPI0011CA50CB|nr:flagellin [Clostridium tyrobutyricum]
MIINHNLMANNALRNMNINSNNAAKSMQKLSSGLRINGAADDAAGLAISEKMRGQINGLNQASSNAQDSISLIQTGEGALNETHSILQRMRTLAVQSATDTNTDDDRAKIQSEVDELAKEITRISNTTEFNTQNLLAGGLDDTFQIGANKDQNINLKIGAMDAQSLGVAGSKLEATLGSNAHDITDVSLSGEKGTSIADGKTITIAANATSADANWLGTSIGVTGITISTVNNTSDYNDWKFSVSTSGATTLAATVDSVNKTITLIGNATIGNWTNTTINDALSDAGYGGIFTAGTTAATATAVTAKVNTSAASLGLAGDEVSLTATEGSNTGTTIVKNNAATATFTDDKFKGLSLKLDGSTSASTVATITLATQHSSIAGFNPDGSISDEAVAAAGIDVSTQTAANGAIKTIDNAITTVSEERSKLGAYQNRLEHTINNLGTSSENLTSAESRIRDVDMASEMSEYSKNNILSQAAQAMLAQANQQPQQVLQLLR